MRALPAALLAVALLATGCSSGLLGPTESTSTELREMKERILELQRKAAAAEAELERLRLQVAALEARRPSVEPPPAVAAAQPPAPDLGPRDPVVIDVSDVESEDLPTAVRTSPPRPAAPPVAAPPANQPANQPESESSPTAALDAAGQAVYDRGYTLYHQGRYVDAESAFQRFLQSYPDTGLADNAQYWIGEARFARGDIAGALAAFRETVERFPEGNKTADAMLKVGDCLAALGDIEAARAQYDAVARRFPSSAASAMAEERRARLP